MAVAVAEADTGAVPERVASAILRAVPSHPGHAREQAAPVGGVPAPGRESPSAVSVSFRGGP
jgi:hypothetical protein